MSVTSHHDLRGADLTSVPDGVLKLKHLTKLDLRVNRLNALPFKLSKLSHLQTLLIRCNEFHELPSVVCKLKNLIHFDISTNHIEFIHDGMANLVNLQNLDLSFNIIRELTTTFGRSFKKMTRLDISHNKLSSLPESFGEMTSLESLKLGSNRLTKLPASFAKLLQLKSLEIDENGMRDFPESICQMMSLKELRANNNSFQRLPDHFGNKLHMLEVLILHNNGLRGLPDSLCQLPILSSLDLSNNEILNLPANFGKLSRLGKEDGSVFSLLNNPLDEPPLEICARGIDVIREYLSGQGFFTIRKKMTEKKRSDLTVTLDDVDDGTSYSMNHRPRGVAVIVDNIGVGANSMTGDNSDADKLRIFLTKIGFSVRVYRDKTSDEILQVMEVIALEDHSNFDCFLACFVANGSPDLIFGEDSLPVSLVDVAKCVNARHCPALIGKPKIFLTHACAEYDIAEMANTKPEVSALPKSPPVWEDFLFCFNIFQGAGAEERSVFISKLLSSLELLHSLKDLRSIMYNVMDGVASDVETAFVFSPVSTLKKKLILS